MKKFSTSIVSLLGMLFVIGTAFGLDNWTDNLRRVARQEFSGTLSWLVLAYMADLLLAGLLLVWLWFVYKKDENIRVVAIIYILVGLGLLFYNVVVFALAPTQLPSQSTIVPKSLSAFVSAVVAIVGFQRLFVGKIAP